MKKTEIKFEDIKIGDFIYYFRNSTNNFRFAIVTKKNEYSVFGNFRDTKEEAIKYKNFKTTHNIPSSAKIFKVKLTCLEELLI